ncbi:S26 family signal peptidase [Mycobacterium spongiae]|uniref:S26 family signal peptidase n=2 Tax=Mycobacterium spongiae TaxID=886343 RepID=A0A975K221_9MYCO|nr:S26 family signal peptidase [Mycobacterium spongiae]
MRRFRVAEDSMRPTLVPGDGLLVLRSSTPRPGQIRLFRDPRLPSRWLVKRVGNVRGAGRHAAFEACSDNPDAPGVVDSRQFGWVTAAGSYRVVWIVRGPNRG